MLQDLRFAFRTFRKRPSSNGVVVLMLALGIAANSIVFSLVEAFLLRPLDFADPERLVRVYATQEVVGGDRMWVTPGTFFDWRRQSQSFEKLVAAQNTGLAVTDAERALNPLMRRVSEDYFETLRGRARLGAALLRAPSISREGAPRSSISVSDRATSAATPKCWAAPLSSPTSPMRSSV